MYENLSDLLYEIGYMYNDTNAEERLVLLQNLIHRANIAYNNNLPILSEVEYNELIVMTHKLEDAHGLPRTEDCSTVTVDKTLKPMYSLKKVYDTDRLIEFLTKFNNDDKVLIEPKLDGVSMTVCYRDCTFSHLQLKTRTFDINEAKMLPIADIDKMVNETTSISSVDVRGEVVIDLDKFDNYVSDFSNARTMVSSMLNTKVPYEMGYPHDLFEFIAFETMPPVDLPSSFTMVDSAEYSVSATVALIKQDDLNEVYKETIPYLLDGLVFKLPAYEHLGYTKKFPRHHIALKYLSETVVSKIRKICVNETLKGIRQSVTLEIDPTGIGGIVVRSINLGSVEVLESLSINEGDYAKFTLSGGIIPVLLDVIKSEE